MHYFCVSFTHKNTDIALREKLSFSDATKKKEILRLINSHANIQESFVLSTCNRVEIFAYVKELSKISEHINACIALLCEVDKELLNQKADVFEDSGAIHHLFSVASSLDSLVIGETQITGQLKDAFYFAKNEKALDIHLSQALYFAFKCAAKVRNETQISKNPVSVASVAVNKARELIDLKDKSVVVVGAGEMAELACRHLMSHVKEIIILNRNVARAKALFEDLNLRGKFDSLENLPYYINNYEVIFSATNALECIITQDILETKAFKRYFFDIAVPRDIDLQKNNSIEVFTVDDLEEIVERNLALREHQAQIAYAIIARMTEEFFQYLGDLNLAPLIKDLRLKAKECAQKQLQIALDKGYLKHSNEEEARRLIHQVFKAFLHTPTVNLRHIQGKMQSDVVVDAMRYIFDLQDNFENSNEYKCEFNMENNDEI
ncbi:glutamyl-tRNA reductase [Campylobacter sp. US33a]|uniref:glutamyl-tRNA reductase n=1 Tax=Campylobacter sp. US33a TaxID=2498120 RepID=UPI0010684880|nr:glutamyl-tRNA reductase [Campylobacter sp. US33a]TEY01227.1 glutamyl-tRNA reductase [Campylobacter sp. US33a]